MTQSTFYQFRIDPKEKEEAFTVLQELGISPAAAIRMFLRQVKLQRAIPFSNQQSDPQLLGFNEAIRKMPKIDGKDPFERVNETAREIDWGI